MFWAHFRWSIILSLGCLGLAAWWGSSGSLGVLSAVWITLVLGVMEVTLSFDNAVVNAAVLREMDERWRTLFLTVGILIAVFGMRLVFPVLIVSIATGEGLIDVAKLALNDPAAYSAQLTANHVGIAAFGGMFLLLVALSFLFDHERELHWLGKMEQMLSRIGKLDAAHVVVGLITLLVAFLLLPLSTAEQVTFLVAGVGGIILYVLVDSVDLLFETEGAGATAKRAGLAGFLYLEVLDASFSFDGVIGAFAITQDVVIIMLGLGIGALWVRSLTVYLVNRGTLEQYVFLEHGAHYAIGALAVIMLLSIRVHIPEVVTGLIGVAFIGLAVLSSIRHQKKLDAEGG